MSDLGNVRQPSVTFAQPKEMRFSRIYGEWTAADDDLRIVAAGRTKTEAIANWQRAWWSRWFPVTARMTP